MSDYGGKVVVSTRLSPETRARLRAISTLLETSIEQVIEAAVEGQYKALKLDERKIVDQMAKRMLRA